MKTVQMPLDEYQSDLRQASEQAIYEIECRFRGAILAQMEILRGASGVTHATWKNGEAPNALDFLIKLFPNGC